MLNPPRKPRTLELSLKNPITRLEIDRIISAINEAKHPSNLIINFGRHEFTSLAVLRYCKEELNQIADELALFEKIAFVVPAQYQGLNQEKLRYFIKKCTAKEWLEGLIPGS